MVLAPERLIASWSNTVSGIVPSRSTPFKRDPVTSTRSMLVSV